MSSTDLVTILSTDWVDSTATRSRLGEERADQLQQVHDAILRETIEEHEGSVVKNSGDGALATFRSATNALGAAVAIQRRFDARSRSGEQIHLRVGISAGDVVYRDGDVFGTPVVEAVRLEGSAAAGQIVCSDLVRVLARGRGNFDFELLGLLELKGLPEAVAACAVAWDRIETDAEAALPLPPELATSSDTPFVGRGDELRALTEQAIDASQPGAFWVLGEPGIGKTRLAGEVAACAHAAGALVLFGRCDEQLRAPFQPVIEALRWYVSQQTDSELSHRLGGDPGPLARLVPELLTRVSGLRAPEGASEVEQYRLFESVRLWLNGLARDQPVVFVVDDVHWADRPTLSLLGHIARQAEAARLTILGTARDTTPDISEHLSDLVDELGRTGRSRRVELRGLRQADIIEMLGATSLPSTVAPRLVAETAGNPLFVGAVIAAVRFDGTLPAELPGDVRSAVRRRVGRLDRDTVELLQFAALSGLDFSLGVVSGAADIPETVGLGRLEEAVHARLAEEIAVDRFRFTHALVRDALMAELSESRQARMRASLARVIEERFSDQIDEHLRELARHYAGAASPDMLSRALDYARRAAARSSGMLAFDAAAEDLAFALSIVDQMPDYPARDRYELLMEKGDTELQAGAYPDALDTFRAAADIARGESDWFGFSEAAIAFEETSWRPGMLGFEAAAILREAATHELPRRQAVLLRCSLGRTLYYCGRDDDARRISAEGLAAARELGDPLVLGHALVCAGQTHAWFREGSSEIVLAHCRELLTIVDQQARLDNTICVASQYAAMAALTIGDRIAFDEWVDHLQHFGELAGSRFTLYVKLCDEQLRCFMEGDLEGAERLAMECLNLGLAFTSAVDGGHGVRMFMIRREQGRLNELAPVVRMLLEVNPTAAMWRPGLTMLLSEVDMIDEARTLLDDLGRDDFAAIPRDTLFAGALCFLAETAVRVGDTSLATRIADQLRPWENLGVALGHNVGYVGAVNRYLALIDRLLGRRVDAERRLGLALEMNRRMGANTWVAHTLADWARLRAEAGDTDGARRMASEARVLANRYGLVAVTTKIEQVGAV